MTVITARRYASGQMYQEVGMNTNHGCPFVARTRHTVDGYLEAIRGEHHAFWLAQGKKNGRLATMNRMCKVDPRPAFGMKLEKYRQRAIVGGAI